VDGSDYNFSAKILFNRLKSGPFDRDIEETLNEHTVVGQLELPPSAT